MTTLTRWTPNSDLVPLNQVMRQLFHDDFLRPLGEWPANGFESIPVDIAEQGNQLIVKASVPGIPAEDIQVEVKDNILTISGEMKEEKESKDQEQNWYVKEHRYGHFARSLRLPAPVDSGNVSATLKNGVLTLTLPKQAAATGSRIQVKNG